MSFRAVTSTLRTATLAIRHTWTPPLLEVRVGGSEEKTSDQQGMDDRPTGGMCLRRHVHAWNQGGRSTARDTRLGAGAEGRRLEVEAAQPTDSTVRQQAQDRVVPTKRTAATAPEGANKSTEREVGAAATAPTNDVPPKQHVYGVPYAAEKAPPLSNAGRWKSKREKKRQERAQAEAEEHIHIFA